jgi:hypothetical protein
VAKIVTALNDANRSMIGNPRRGTYAVSFITKQIEETEAFSQILASLGLEVRINRKHDELGQLQFAYVVLYRAPDQKRLFEVVEGQLEPNRRERFEQLVLARGPIPEDIIEKIHKVDQRGWSLERIASRMNEAGIIAGMGGHQWTPKKVKAVLAGGSGHSGSEREG